MTLEAIQAALAAATRRPWFTESDGVYNAGRSYLVCPTGDSDQDRANAHLIAHAPEWLQALVDVAVAAQEVRDAHWSYRPPERVSPSGAALWDALAALEQRSAP